MKFDIKTSYPTTTRLSTWLGFKNFYIDHGSHQQNAHADALTSLAASLALPARATEEVLVHSHDLYCLKFALEDSKAPNGDLQVKEILGTSTGPEPRICDSHSLTLSCLTYCLIILRWQLQSKRKLLSSIAIWSREYYIADLMMKSYSASFHTKRHMRHSKKLMMVCAELTNLDPSS